MQTLFLCLTFRTKVATFVKQLHENCRPMVLTQRARSVAVLMDIHEYEKMQERLEILEEVYKAEEQISSGDGIAHEDAKSRVLSGLAGWRLLVPACAGACRGYRLVYCRRQSGCCSTVG